MRNLRVLRARRTAQTIGGTYFGRPEDLDAFGFKWDGEWEVTYVTFRDMGLAFGAALVLIYMLVVAEFRNFMLPLVVMAPIPLTLIGIIPGHWMLGADFTATSMIGFIALAGIIVRNSILLVDFAKGKVAEGMSVRDAVVLAAEVRMRPIMITALALVVGSIVLLTDPIFQGMAVSLLFGSIVATFLTLVVIPLGCFSAQKAFKCQGWRTVSARFDRSCSARRSRRRLSIRRGDSSGGNSGGVGGRPPRLAKRIEPAVGASAAVASAAEATSSGGRPPRLAKKTEVEAAAGRQASAAPVVSGRPPRLAKKTETEPPVAIQQVESSSASVRPPRLQKRVEAVSAAVPPPASQTSSRPARLEKRPADVAAAKVVPEPLSVATQIKDEAESTPVLTSDTAAVPTAREPASFNKRKLRGIRIKMMDEGPDEK